MPVTLKTGSFQQYYQMYLLDNRRDRVKVKINLDKYFVEKEKEMITKISKQQSYHAFSLNPTAIKIKLLNIFMTEISKTLKQDSLI